MDISLPPLTCLDCIYNCIDSEDFSDEDILDINQSRSEVVFAKGETVFKQNSFISNIVFIREGYVKLVLEGSNGKNFAVKFYGPNEYLGVSQIFGKNISNYTVVSLTTSVVCMIEREYFKNFILKRMKYAEKIFQQCAQDHHFLYKRLELLGTKNLNARLSDTLLYLDSDQFKDFGIYNYITRKDLAELSAMSIESMIRLLNEFKQDKLIDINGKNISIRNMNLLNLLIKTG
jgi:CRP/FNR family transcriptional regulator